MSDVQAAAFPEPDWSELGRPFWDALKEGQLTFQRCSGCGNAWLPARSECPRCLRSTWRREPAEGGATLVSWVVYHHCYDAAFADRLPYTVAVVQLDEGPRMITNIVGASPGQLRIDQRLRLRIEPQGDLAVPRFSPA